MLERLTHWEVGETDTLGDWRDIDTGRLAKLKNWAKGKVIILR